MLQMWRKGYDAFQKDKKMIPNKKAKKVVSFFTK